jgi:hypothetical protein
MKMGKTRFGSNIKPPFQSQLKLIPIPYILLFLHSCIPNENLPGLINPYPKLYPPFSQIPIYNSRYPIKIAQTGKGWLDKIGSGAAEMYFEDTRPVLAG